MLFSLDTRVVIVPAARYDSGTKFKKFKKLGKLRKFNKKNERLP
jgi:hypothetical protein